MPLTIWNCVLSHKEDNYFSENKLALPKNYFHNRIPVDNFLLPIFCTGGKWQTATVNFEP